MVLQVFQRVQEVFDLNHVQLNSERLDIESDELFNQGVRLEDLLLLCVFNQRLAFVNDQLLHLLLHSSLQVEAVVILRGKVGEVLQFKDLESG